MKKPGRYQRMHIASHLVWLIHRIVVINNDAQRKEHRCVAVNVILTDTDLRGLPPGMRSGIVQLMFCHKHLCTAECSRQTELTGRSRVDISGWFP